MSAAEPTTPPSGDDTSLHVRRAVAGDASAVGRVAERLTPLLVAGARLRLSKAGLRDVDPEDVVAEAWKVALPKLDRLTDQGGRLTPVLLAYLASTIRNIVGSLLRSRALRGPVAPLAGDSTGGVPTPAADATGVVTGAVRAERRDLVHAALGRLDEIDREILVLRGVEQRSLTEAANLLGLAPNTTAMRYRRALDRLRAELPDSVFTDLADE